VPLKEARRLAVLLGAASQLIFERVIRMAEAQTKATFIEENFREILPFMGGLDAPAIPRWPA
jgi:hypothetical protein